MNLTQLTQPSMAKKPPCPPRNTAKNFFKKKKKKKKNSWVQENVHAPAGPSLHCRRKLFLAAAVISPLLLRRQDSEPACEARCAPRPTRRRQGSNPYADRIPATVHAFFVTDLYAKDAGYVSQVNNDIGDHVKQGQVLAVIWDPELKAQFDRAQAAVEQAKATLEVAKRQLAGMQADLVLQQVTLKRQKELFAGSAATAQALDEAQAKQGVSSATVETGKAKITLAEADIEAAKAEAERLHALLQYDKVIAPFDGVVTRRLVNPGDLFQAATSTRTTPLFTVRK